MCSSDLFAEIDGMVSLEKYQDVGKLKAEYRKIILEEIERERKSHE